MEYFTSLAAAIAAGALLPSVFSFARKFLAARAKNFTLTVTYGDGSKIELSTGSLEEAEEILDRLNSIDQEDKTSSIEKGDR
ncbi:MAG: hypothetical protein FWE15_00115 [Actinomycetia bacterium]|nr:hypothetical protein [Actinomycetes bacterium]